jgi:superfamily II DNA or RNA helicase
MKNMLSWQNECFKRYEAAYEVKPIFVVVAGTGSGKTPMAVNLSSYARMREAEVNPLIICVTPWRSTKRGFKKWFAKSGLRASSNNNHAGDPSLDAVICTYASASEMLRMAETEGRPVILVLDEFHHLKEGNAWAEPYAEMQVGDGRGVIRAVLLSGTPWHEDGELVTSLVEYEEIETVVNGRKKVEQRVKSDISYSYGRAVSEQDDERNVVPIAFIPINGETTQEKYSKETGEIIPGEGRVLNTETMGENDPLSPFVDFTSDTIWDYDAATELLDKAVAKLTLLRHGENTEYVGGLVVTMRKEQAEAVQRYLKEQHQKSAIVVTSDDPKSHKKIEDFSDNPGEEWIIAVEQISEGVDIPRLKVMADLTNKRTSLHIIQRWGRILRRVRKPDDSFAVNADAFCFFINHPKLAEVALLIEDEMKQYKKELKDNSNPPKITTGFKTTGQSYSGSGYIAHGESEEGKVAALALWLWDTNYHGIRSGRRSHIDCMFTAREMLNLERVPDAFNNDQAACNEKPPRSYEDVKQSASESLTKATGRLAHAFFDGDYSQTQAYLNKKMDIKAWTIKTVSVEMIRERTALADKAVLSAA